LQEKEDDAVSNEANSKKRNGGGGADCGPTLERLLSDIDLMFAYATSIGKAISPQLAAGLAELHELGLLDSGAAPREATREQRFKLALQVHGLLSEVVAPATPLSIRVTEPAEAGRFRSFARRNWAILVLLALLLASLIGVVVTSMLPRQAEPTGTSIWVQHLQYAAAAGLGAAFYSLFTAYRYMVRRTYDPQYNQVYVIRWVLGFAAGTILAYFGADLFKESGNELAKVGPGVLALVGGYAADAVAQILKRVADTLVTLVRGSDTEVLEAREKEIKANAEKERTRDRQDVVSRLTEVMGKTAEAENPEDIRKEIKGIVDSLLQ
jgi:hypothetical protein